MPSFDFTQNTAVQYPIASQLSFFDVLKPIVVDYSYWLEKKKES